MLSSFMFLLKHILEDCELFLFYIQFALQKSLLHILCRCSCHHFMYCAVSWIVESTFVCVFLSALSLNLLILLCPATSSSFAQESRQYQGYKCPMPFHCTNVLIIETFSPEPTVAREILFEAATEDLAEGVKAGKDEMQSAPGKCLR